MLLNIISSILIYLVVLIVIALTVEASIGIYLDKAEEVDFTTIIIISLWLTMIISALIFK